VKFVLEDKVALACLKVGRNFRREDRMQLPLLSAYLFEAVSHVQADVICNGNKNENNIESYSTPIIHK
jgi:hypothetical protein